MKTFIKYLSLFLFNVIGFAACGNVFFNYIGKDVEATKTYSILVFMFVALVDLWIGTSVEKNYTRKHSHYKPYK